MKLIQVYRYPGTESILSSVSPLFPISHFYCWFCNSSFSQSKRVLKLTLAKPSLGKQSDPEKKSKWSWICGEEIYECQKVDLTESSAFSEEKKNESLHYTLLEKNWPIFIAFVKIHFIKIFIKLNPWLTILVNILC